MTKRRTRVLSSFFVMKWLPVLLYWRSGACLGLYWPPNLYKFIYLAVLRSNVMSQKFTTKSTVGSETRTKLALSSFCPKIKANKQTKKPRENEKLQAHGVCQGCRKFFHPPLCLSQISSLPRGCSFLPIVAMDLRVTLIPRSSSERFWL